MTTAPARRCPACQSGLARRGDDPPWCPKCEWNLGDWADPKDGKHKRAIRRSRTRAFAINQGVLAELSGALPERPRLTRSRVLLAAASVTLFIFDIALLVGGVLLLVDGVGVARFLGFIMILLGIECRVRFYKVDTSGAMNARRDAPELAQLVDEACTTLGSPRIHAVLVSDEFNASCARSGLRRRAQLVVGIRVWGSLSPEARLALLGHEIGHLVNRDPRTGFLTQPALTTFARLANVFDPEGLVMMHGRGSFVDFLTKPLAYLFFAPVHLYCRWAHIVLLRVAARDHQRAEAYADAMSVRLGGSSGAVELARVLLFGNSAVESVRRAGRDGANEPHQWHERVTEAIRQRTDNVRTVEQLSMRYEVSEYASHPPPGVRHRLVTSWPECEPALVVESERWQRIDEELRPQFARTAKALARGTLS